MGEQHSLFESLVTSVRSAELKKMAQRWGGSYQSRKEECLALILAGLRDPERVREVVVYLDHATPVQVAFVERHAERVQLLAPYLRGALAPDVLLVDSERLAALRERLAWAGLSVSETLDVT
jgi:hypothetical protein